MQPEKVRDKLRACPVPDTGMSGNRVTELLMVSLSNHSGVNRKLFAFPCFAAATNMAKDCGLVKTGDLIVITGGIPPGQAGTTNMLKVEKIS